MKERRLLYAIGWVKDEYIEEMQQSNSPRVSKKRIWLIAAVIAALLLLAGCVAVFLRLQNMSIGQVPYEERYDEYGHQIDPTEKLNDVLTFNGPVGSPGYEAAKQWYEFRESLDMEPIPNGQEDLSIPENLRITYYCYTWEMANKVTELAQEYNLKLADAAVLAQEYASDISLDALGVTGLAHDHAKVDYGASYFEPPYNFRFKMSLNPLEENPQWPAQLASVTYRYIRKDYFPSYGTQLVDLEEYSQWDYVCADGTKVLLALRSDGGHAYILAEQKDAYIAVGIQSSLRKFLIEGTDYGRSMTAPVLEEIAEIFRYDILPNAVDGVLLQEKLDIQEAERREENAIRYHQESYSDFADFLMKHHYESFYTFYDLDGDGNDEMLIGDGTGLITTYLTRKDNVTLAYYPALPDGTRLLQNGGISYWEETSEFDANFSCYFYHPFDEQVTLHFDEDQINTRTGGFAEGIKYENQQWYSMDYNAFPPKRTPISESEARSVMEKYSELVLEWYSLEDYPIDATGKTLGEYLQELEASMTYQQRLEMFRQQALKIQSQYGCNYYLLRDIDGDGYEELLLSLNGRELMFIFDIRYGEVTNILQRDIAYLCERDVIEEVKDHFSDEEGQQIFRSYLTFDGGERQEVAFVYENVTSGTYSDNMDLRPITEANAKSIQMAFPRINIEMELISGWSE